MPCVAPSVSFLFPAIDSTCSPFLRKLLERCHSLQNVETRSCNIPSTCCVHLRAVSCGRKPDDPAGNSWNSLQGRAQHIDCSPPAASTKPFVTICAGHSKACSKEMLCICSRSRTGQVHSQSPELDRQWLSWYLDRVDNN